MESMKMEASVFFTPGSSGERFSKLLLGPSSQGGTGGEWAGDQMSPHKKAAGTPLLHPSTSPRGQGPQLPTYPWPLSLASSRHCG